MSKRLVRAHERSVVLAPTPTPLVALLQALVRDTRDALLVLAPDGLVEVWNPAATRLFGHQEPEALGRHVASLLFDHEDEGRAAPPRDTAALLALGAQGPWRALLSLPGAGGPAPYILRSSALPGGYGLLLATPALALDTDERDAFYGTVGHELRTPATVASGFLQLLRHRVSEQAPALSALADTSVHGMQRLLLVIDNLATYSLLQRDQLALVLSSFDLSDALQDLARQLAQEEGRSILCPPDPPPCPLVADRLRVMQLVAHLLRNALDYSAQATPVVLVWGADTAAHEAVIHVSDQGLGISVPVQETLYDGVTGSGSVGHRGGLGLGLYLARALARAQGGESTLAMTGQTGSTFEARLPLAPVPL